MGWDERAAHSRKRREKLVCFEMQADRQQSGVCEHSKPDLYGNNRVFNAIVQPVRQTAGGAGGKTGRGSYGQLRVRQTKFSVRRTAEKPAERPSAGGAGQSFGPGRAPDPLLHHYVAEPGGVLYHGQRAGPKGGGGQKEIG